MAHKFENLSKESKILGHPNDHSWQLEIVCDSGIKRSKKYLKFHIGKLSAGQDKELYPGGTRGRPTRNKVTMILIGKG